MWHIPLKCCWWTDSISWGKSSCYNVYWIVAKENQEMTWMPISRGVVEYIEIHPGRGILHIYIKKSVRYASTDLEGVPNVLLNEKAGWRELNTTTISFLKQNNKNSLGMCPFVCMRDEKVVQERVTCLLTLVALGWVERREIGGLFVFIHLGVAFMHSHTYYKWHCLL